MAKFLSGTRRELKLGISSYTDNSTVLQATGRVAINTSTADAELHVVGDAIITGLVTTSELEVETAISAGGSITAPFFYGDGSTLDNVVTFNEVEGPTPQFIGFLTATTGPTVPSLGSDGSFVFIPSTKNVGISTINPTERLDVIGNVRVSGFVSASEYYGDQVIGEPTGGFLPGAVGIETADFTKDSVNEINFILGKLVPKPPFTFAGEDLILTGLTGLGRLCAGFSPSNNTGGDLTPSAGTQYSRNTDSTVTSNYLTEFGPGDTGTVTGFVNAVGVGTTTLTVGVNDGTYGSLQILNDKDAFFSSRNPGINSEFYEVYDVRLINAPCPDGFNKAFITHLAAQTNNAYWYEDPSTVAAPILTVTTSPITPTSPSLNYSSGVPHYDQSSANGFDYVMECENATGDMYTTNTFLSSSGQTAGFQNGGSKSYPDFDGGVNPPVQNYGVGTGVTCLITQVPRDLHLTVTTNAQKFSNYTASTPYGSDSERATITQSVNIMGTTARTNDIDEDNILVSSLGTGSGNAVRTNSDAGDNPTPIYTSWVPSSSVATYESVVRGAVLRHDQTDYSTGYLPVGPDYSSGRTGAQYFQVEIIRSQVSQFLINVTGSYAGCWVCMPDNSTWTTSLSGVNGWADMFLAYRGAGVPTTAEPGCSSGGAMSGSSGTFTCVFGTESSSNDTNNRILIRWRLNSGQSITDMSFSNT